MIYLYCKAFHLISVICWMVGLLYLPRIYVYHAEVSKGSITYNLFLIMEKRLLSYILLPSMISSLIFGLLMLYSNHSIILESYFIFKIILLIILFGFHGYLIKLYKAFETNQNLKTPNFFRSINEIPTVLMIIIIILVVVQPDMM